MSVFKVKDLMIRVLGGGGGGASLCSEDVSVTAPTPITPYILVAAHQPLFERLQEMTRKSMATDPDVDPASPAEANPEPQPWRVLRAIDDLALDVGRQVVVAAVGGGGVYMPDPNCGGSSMETIPTPITPVVHKIAVTVRASDLPRLKAQLNEVVAMANEAEQALSPRSAADRRLVGGKLKGALEGLG